MAASSVGPAQKLMLELVGIAAFVLMLEGMQQMREPTSKLRLLLAEAGDWIKESWRQEELEQQMRDELSTILKGGA